MQQQWLFLMLLAVTCLRTAHGRTFPLNKDFMTSQLAEKDAAAVGQMDESNLDLDNVVTIRTPSSAVQYWSLVCQQLCGAALGGAVCAPYCENLPFLPFEVQLANAEQILDSKRDLLCPELCGLQLGDDVCTCKNYIIEDTDADVNDEQQEGNVCAVLCDHTHVTLTGCTPCKSQGEGKNNMKVKLNKFQNFSQKEVVPPFEVSVASTPNWTQLCAALCKTGDGGSLCNCNLSPFKSNHGHYLNNKNYV